LAESLLSGSGRPQSQYLTCRCLHHSSTVDPRIQVGRNHYQLLTLSISLAYQHLRGLFLRARCSLWCNMDAQLSFCAALNCANKSTQSNFIHNQNPKPGYLGSSNLSGNMSVFPNGSTNEGTLAGFAGISRHHSRNCWKEMYSASCCNRTGFNTWTILVEICFARPCSFLQQYFLRRRGQYPSEIFRV
jgi:hypothetical protein